LIAAALLKSKRSPITALFGRGRDGNWNGAGGRLSSISVAGSDLQRSLRTVLETTTMMTYVGCLLALSLGATPDEAKPLAGAVIVVDPGHGGQRYSKSYTGGTRGVDSKLTESELNLRVAFELAKALKENGATVYMTREADHRLSKEGSSGSDELHARIGFFDT
jgi:N-acetylmuramoyl-L-alanine amidase